jgi:hypothetical protein
MRARWKLGQLLAVVERGAGPGRGKKVVQAGPSFIAYLKTLDLPKTDALRAQRIGLLPEAELDKVLAAARSIDQATGFLGQQISVGRHVGRKTAQGFLKD